MADTFIYALADPATHLVRYVGKADDPVVRLRHHKVDRSATHRARWIRGLRAKGQTPELIVLGRYPSTEWEEAERFWIREYRSSGYDLLNRTDGGEGGGHSGFVMDAAMRAKLSVAMRGKRPWNKGLAHSDATRHKISAALRGRPTGRREGPSPSEETRQKMREAHIGHPVSAATRLKMSLAHQGNKGRLGQHLTDKHRAKLAEAVSAGWTPERREALIARNKARGGLSLAYD